MKSLLKLAVIAVAAMLVQMGSLEKVDAASIQYRPPTINDLVLQTGVINLTSITSAQPVFMKRTETAFTTINSNLAVSGDLFATGLITGLLDVQSGGAVDISKGLLEVTGGVTMHDGSELMIGGGTRVPAPPPPPPGGSGEDPAIGGAGGHTVYANIGGVMTDVTGAVDAVMIGGGRAPSPPSPAPGGIDGGFLKAASLTLESGSSLNFAFNSALAAGESLLLAELGGIVTIGNNVGTNLQSNTLMYCSDPFLWGVSDADWDRLLDRYTNYGNAPVPEPSTVFLLGVGLAGLVGTRIRKRMKARTI